MSSTAVTGNLVSTATTIVEETDGTTTTATISVAITCAGAGSGILAVGGVLAGIAFINACIQTSGWRRRQGYPYVELTTLLYFFMRLMGDLANVILVTTFGFSMYVYATNNTGGQQYALCGTFTIVVGIAFIFKAIEILNLIREQSSIDIFLIDWEQPPGKPLENGMKGVSIWRSVLTTNEWNEIQTSRKISTPFQMFAVLFILSIVSANNSAFTQSTSDEVSAATKFAIGALTYVCVAIAQTLYFLMIHERLIKDEMRDFMDLCSICNVSVFVLVQNNFGYYIHGRSIHGRSDVDMSQMNHMMRREEEGSVPRRGLLSESDKQVFEIMIPQRMREKFDIIYRPLQQMGIQQQRGNVEEDRIKVHHTMQKFLQAFLDHALVDLDYFVKEKLFFERIFGMNFQEATDMAYLTVAGETAFANVLYYGNEIALISFDVLLFFLLDITTNYVLAVTVTFIVGEVLKVLRSEAGRHNLAKKTLIDKRFLI